MRSHFSKHLHHHLAFMRTACFKALSISILSLLMNAGQVCFSQTQTEKTIAIDNLEVYYFTQDPHYLNVTAQLSNIKSSLDGLKSAVTHAITFPNRSSSRTADGESRASTSPYWGTKSFV